MILITYVVGGLAGVIDPAAPTGPQLLLLIATGYVFKFTVALIDTVPFYFGTAWLSRYLEIDPRQEHAADVEELTLDDKG